MKWSNTKDYFQQYLKITNSKSVNILNTLQGNPVEALQIFFMGDMKWMEIYLVTQLNQFVTKGKWKSLSLWWIRCVFSHMEFRLCAVFEYLLRGESLFSDTC